MSTAALARAITQASTRRVHATIVSAVLTLGAVAAAMVVLWQPWGERDKLSYADLAPHADAAWLGTVVDGLAVAAIGVTLGLAVCRLAHARGYTLATVGAVLTGFGGVAFCGGMVAFGTLAWYATNTDAVSADDGAALMGYVENNPEHALGLQMAGFALYTLGSLVLMSALWRARSVPRWLPIAYLVLTVGLFILDGVALNIAQAIQTLSVVVIAYYAWRAARNPQPINR
jgi:hypothetical protein